MKRQLEFVKFMRGDMMEKMDTNEIQASAPEQDIDTQAPVAPESAKAEEDTELQRRLSGLSRRLDEALKERARLETELRALREEAEKSKLERMSDIERLTYERNKLEAELREAREAARRERLRAMYPAAASLFGDDPLPSEERLKVLEEKIRERGQSSHVEENNPMRQVTQKSWEEEVAEANRAFLARMGLSASD